MSDLMTLQELAAYLRVTTKTVYRLLEKGRIPAIKLGRQWRFNREAIDKWLSEKSVGQRIKVLVIDDEPVVRQLFEETIEELGQKIVAVGTGYEGLELIKQQDFHLVFIDLKMPGMDGAQLFHQIKAINQKLPIVIITGYPESHIMTQALTYGPFGVMKKPFGESDIIAAVNVFIKTTTA